MFSFTDISKRQEGDEKCVKILLESLKESDHSEDLGVDGRIVLKWVLREQCLRICIRFIWHKTDR
jgi:hypothetical protein